MILHILSSPWFVYVFPPEVLFPYFMWFPLMVSSQVQKVRDKYSVPEFMYLHIEPAVAVLSHHYILLSFVYSYTSAS